jgi:hypothetical protein
VVLSDTSEALDDALMAPLSKPTAITAEGPVPGTAMEQPEAPAAAEQTHTNWTRVKQAWHAMLSMLGKEKANSLSTVAYLEHGDSQAWILRNDATREVHYHFR